MLEDLKFRSQEGKETPARGELTLYGKTRRATFATLFGVFGVLLGLPTFVPGPHMCVTWVFPLLGAFLAWRTWTLEAELSNLEGTCPACDDPGLKLPGGQLTRAGTVPQICLKCQARFEVVCEAARTDPAISET